MLSIFTVATCVLLYIAMTKMRLYNTKEQRLKHVSNEDILKYLEGG